MDLAIWLMTQQACWTSSGGGYVTTKWRNAGRLHLL